MMISAKNIRFDEYNMWVELSDALTLGVPLAWFPKLMHVSAVERNDFELSRRGDVTLKPHSAA